MMMQMRPPLSSLLSLHSFPSFTPTALNSKAQRRAVPCEAFRRSMVAHAGVPISQMIEPQRGSTTYLTSQT